MSLDAWWSGLSRAYKNAFVMFFFDTLILLGALLKIKPLQATWEVLVSYSPNVLEVITLQFIALVRGVSPGAVVASSLVLIFVTAYLSLLIMHAVMGFGVGFLFDKLPDTKIWSVVNYFVLVLLVAFFHLFLIYSALAF